MDRLPWEPGLQLLREFRKVRCWLASPTARRAASSEPESWTDILPRMATLLHKRFYGGILLSNTVFSMSVMLLLGASRPHPHKISGMRADVCRTPSPARLVSSTSSHPRPAPVAKCDSGSSPALAKRVRPDPVSTKGIAQG